MTSSEDIPPADPDGFKIPKPETAPSKLVRDDTSQQETAYYDQQYLNEHLLDGVQDREDRHSYRRMREKYAKRSFSAMITWQVLTLLIIIGCGLLGKDYFDLSDTVLIALISASAITSIVSIAVKGMFAPQERLKRGLWDSK